MSARVCFAITTGREPARVTSFDALQELIDEELWEYGHELEVVFVEINPPALNEFPEGCDVEATDEDIGADIDIQEGT